MSPKHSPSAAPVAVGILLSSLLLAGCATEKALTQQTQPLQDQIVRLEQAIATSGDAATRAAQQQTGAIATRQTALDKQLQDLRVAMRAMEDQLATLAEQNRAGARRIDEVAHLAQATDRRIEALDTRRDAELAGIGALTEQLAQAESRLRVANNLALKAARLGDENKLKLEEDAKLLAKLAERVGQGEARLQDAAAVTQDTARKVDEMAARRLADAADDLALNARLTQAEQRLKVLSDQVQEAMALAAKEIFLAVGREAFTVTLTDDKVLYPLNDPNLDRRDVAKLDDLVRRLGELDQEYHLDIQGHTDNTSTDDNNYNLGKARAEVVKRYLAERKGISISRMSTTSYGANKPLDVGARQNRRIHIRALVLK